MHIEDLSQEIRDEYVSMRSLPDGRIVGVKQLLFHWTMHVDIDGFGYADRWCFATRELAEEAMADWYGDADPINWHRHPTSGRRRDLETGRIWVEP